MKNDDLNMHLNLDEVEGLNQKRTSAFINSWIVDVVQHLNQISSLCQDQIHSLESKLERTSDSLSLLEYKLSSIPGLTDDDDKVINECPSLVNTETIVVSDQNTQDTTEQLQKSSVVEEAAEDKDEALAQETQNTIRISSHPSFASFFKMVNFGVPREAVKLKMKATGLDPSLLDDPEKLIEMDVPEEAS